MSLLIAILLSLCLGVVHFWNEKIFFKKETIKAKTMSFIAGASVAYVFYIFYQIFTRAYPILINGYLSLFF